MIGAMAGWASRMRLVSERKRSAHPSSVVSPRRYRDRSKETRRVSSCAPDVLSLANWSSSGSHVIDHPPTTPPGGAIIGKADRESKRNSHLSGAMFAPAGIDVLAY